MKKVKLSTDDGRHVHAILMPPFKDLPDVVLWGSRSFLLWDSEGPEYRECFAYTVPLVNPS